MQVCFQKPPFEPEFARGSDLLSFTLSVKFKQNPKENSNQNPFWTFWVSPGFYLKEPPSVPLKLYPSLHATQLKSNSALQKGLQTSIKYAVNLGWPLGIQGGLLKFFKSLTSTALLRPSEECICHILNYNSPPVNLCITYNWPQGMSISIF